MKALQIHRRTASQYQVDRRVWNGVEYLVVPVVMMVEGVHSGSRGPLFHSASELGRVVAAWNGIPVTISHPQVGSDFVSANSPEQLERSVGVVFNARMDGAKLKAEAYLNPAKLSAISPETLTRVLEGQPLEVSVGVFTDEIEATGQWNSEAYVGIARNHRPDHLALLPNEVGACSINDGCGVRVNSQQTEKDVSKMNQPEMSVFKDLNKQGFQVVPLVNAMGLRELLDKVRSAIDAMDNEQRVFFLEELYEDHFIYRVRVRNTAEEHLYKQKYTIGEDGKIAFDGAPEEVRREVTYTTMSEMVRTKQPLNINKSKEQREMSTPSACIVARVDRIIANSANTFEEADRPWLLLQSEQTLDKLGGVAPAVPPVPPTTPTLDLNAATALVVQSLQKPEDVINLLPENLKSQFQSALQLNADTRKALVDRITAVATQFSAEELNAMQTNMLQKIADSVAPQTAQTQTAAYAAAGGPVTHTNQQQGGEILLPMGVTPKK